MYVYDCCMFICGVSLYCFFLLAAAVGFDEATASPETRKSKKERPPSTAGTTNGSWRAK